MLSVLSITVEMTFILKMSKYIPNIFFVLSPSEKDTLIVTLNWQNIRTGITFVISAIHHKEMIFLKQFHSEYVQKYPQIDFS